MSERLDLTGLWRRTRSVSRQIVGLETIARSCKITVDKLVRWHLLWNFPLRWIKGSWVTTPRLIDKWLLSLPKRDKGSEKGKGRA